jgi:hypothetical protein
MPDFQRYVGVRYSGRKAPHEHIRWLRVFVAREGHEPYQEWNPGSAEGRWSRQELAEWLLEQITGDEATLVGLDHAFSFPQSYMVRNNLKSWDEFIQDFGDHWPTRSSSVRDLLPGNDRQGDPDERRLTGRWSGTPRGGVFRFEHQDGLAKATHAGIPWLDYLRRAGDRASFWPFDGFAPPPAGKSAVAEVRSDHLLLRYPKEGLAKEEHAAYAICAWLQDRDRQDLLRPYFTPPLSAKEKGQALVEGWILGVA